MSASKKAAKTSNAKASKKKKRGAVGAGASVSAKNVPVQNAGVKQTTPKTASKKAQKPAVKPAESLGKIAPKLVPADVPKPESRKTAPTQQAQPPKPTQSVAKHGTRAPAPAESSRHRFTPPRIYAAAAVFVLMTSTIVWAWLSARVQQGNADQLVNSYMFESWGTFRNATFPGAHTFLIKWPVFILVRLLGSSNRVFEFVTVGLTLLTVGLFAYVLHRIERRPAIFGTIILALSSVLLLVPAQPYAGGLLPVNMAMIATRNIEYVIYMGSLILCISAARMKSWQFAAGVLGLVLLASSDKLFLTLSLGGAVAAFVVYALGRQKAMMRFTARWIMFGLIVFPLVAGLLWLIGRIHLTHISAQLDTTPYGTTRSLHDLTLGVLFGGLGILTNFGANPAFDAATVRSMPHLATSRLLSFSGVSYVVNALIFIAGVWAIVRIMMLTLGFTRQAEDIRNIDNPVKLTTVLVWSSLTAIGAFLATNHYYVVDARYLTITLFAAFVALATWSRTVRWPARRWTAVAGCVLVCCIGLGLFSVARMYRAENAALADVNQRNAAVAKILEGHHVATLVGDYWRVLPIRQLTQGKQMVTPLAACTAPRDILSSSSWQPNLISHSFAYLLSDDKSLTNYTHCTLEQIIAEYGRPSDSILIAGTLYHPKESLLLYDNGARASGPVTLGQAIPRQVTSSTTPIMLTDVTVPRCADAPTIMNVVAHEDDDLLFMNPDLLHELQQHDCVRTIYITAGDDGLGQDYWTAREQGAEAAYATMADPGATWIQHTIKLNDGNYVITESPRDNSRITLLFLRLPDGNVMGQGFSSSGYANLAKLEAGQISALKSVDGHSSYTAAELTSDLQGFITLYQPSEIHTQLPYSLNKIHPDHSDHMAVGKIVTHAYQESAAASADTPLTYYAGYPIRDLRQNVSGDDLDQKTAAFLAYAQNDGAVCHTAQECDAMQSYGAYLRRQYATVYDHQ